MFGFGRNKGSGDEEQASSSEAATPERETRAQLLARIQHLLEKNSRYEMRFRDVVGAYKSVLKEKEALEKTVAALTATDAPAAAVPAAVATSGTATDDDGGRASDSEQGGAAGASDAETSVAEQSDSESTVATPTPARTPTQTPSASAASEEVTMLKSQLNTLKQALRTITEEKNSMQGKFQADKKTVAESHRAALAALQEEHEAEVAKVKFELETAQREKEQLAGQIRQLSEQLTTSHEIAVERERAWERERQMHQLELAAVRNEQQSDAKDKSRLQDLEQKLVQARDAEVDAFTQLNTATASFRDRISQLESELAQTQTKLLAAEAKGDSDELLALKKELRVARIAADNFKKQVEEANKKQEESAKVAQRRVEDAEARLSSLMRQQEERDALSARERMLHESRLSEFSALVGRYEQARAKDAETIAELREKIADLQDQHLLAQETPATSQRLGDDHDAHSVAALQEKVNKLKSLLWMANSRAKGSEIEGSGLFDGTDAIPVPSFRDVALADEDDSDRLPLEIALRQEVEDYYERCQVLVKSKNELARRMTVLQRQKEQLESQVAELRSTSEEALKQACERWESENDTLRQRLESEVDALKQQHDKETQELKQAAQKLRERTVVLMADRDAEIARLRKRLGSLDRQDVLSSLVDSPSYASGASTFLEHGPDSEDSSVPQSPAPSGTPLDGLSVGSGSLIHFASMEAERSGERSRLRRRIRELEANLMDGHEREQLLTDQLTALREEIRRLERNAKREGANLEYLKNVVYSYMVKTVSRDRTIPAIATILQFSPAELKSVREAHQQGWFG